MNRQEAAVRHQVHQVTAPICPSPAADTSGHSARRACRPLPLVPPAPKSTARSAFPVLFGGIPMRPSRRAPDELRAVSLERGVVKYAEGSCMVNFGDTHVLVTATLEERLPPWLKGQGRGWVTAEYGMLPRATLERTRREASAGKQNGRT